MSASAFIDSDVELDSIADEIGSDIDSLYEDRHNGHGDHIHGVSTAQAAKAIEVAQEIDDSPGASLDTAPLLPFSSPSQQGWDAPILDAGPAPPDYAAATSSRQLAPSVSAESIARIPQSMSDGLPLYGNNNGDAFARPRFPSLLHKALGNRMQRNRRIGVFSLAFALVSIALILIMKRTHKRDTLEFASQHYLSSQRMHEDCKLDNSMGWIDLPFEDPTSFSFIDNMTGGYCSGPGFTACDRAGQFDIVYIPHNDTAYMAQNISILVRISIATGSPWRIEEIDYEKTNDSLILSQPNVPAYASWGDDTTILKAQCLDTQVRVYIRKNTSLTNFVVKLSHFTLQGSQDATRDSYVEGYFGQTPPRVNNSTFIQVDYGSVHSMSLNSRKTHIESRSGNISATILFGDELHLQSWDGNINAVVYSWDLRPDSEKDSKRTIRTVTQNGNTTIDNGSPEDQPFNVSMNYTAMNHTEKFPLHVYSEHLTSSGPITLRYPSDWVGTIEGMSVHGYIKLRGIEHEQDKSAQGESAEVSSEVGGHEEAHSSGAGHVKFATDTGNVDILVGKSDMFLYEHTSWTSSES